MILGLRPVTRRRYGPTTWASGYATRPTPVSATVQASVDVAPRSEWALDADGNRTRRVVDLVSWADFRGVAADDPSSPTEGAGYLADRIVIDGRVYEVQDVIRMEPCEGIPRTHYETRAVEIRGSDEGVA